MKSVTLKLTMVLFALTALTPLFAGTIKLDFEGTSNSGPNDITHFYQQQYGITISNNVLSWNTAGYNTTYFSYVDPNDANCASNDGMGNCTSLKMPFSNNTVLQGRFGTSPNIIINVAHGLTGILSLQSGGSERDSTVDVFSGNNGTGALLGTIFIPASGTGVLTVWSNEIGLDPTFTLDLTGLFGRSIVLHQVDAQFIEYDNISFTDAGLSPVPEPASLLLFGSGLASGALGLRIRRRRKF